MQKKPWGAHKTMGREKKDQLWKGTVGDEQRTLQRFLTTCHLENGEEKKSKKIRKADHTPPEAEIEGGGGGESKKKA